MITQIIWLLTWPLLITFCWFAINWVLKKAEGNWDSSKKKEAPDVQSLQKY